MKYARKRKAWVGSPVKLIVLLGNVGFELALISAVQIVDESDTHDDQSSVEGNVLNGVTTNPVVLDLLRLAVKLEHWSSPV